MLLSQQNGGDYEQKKWVYAVFLVSLLVCSVLLGDCGNEKTPSVCEIKVV